ncbi:MAG: CoA pyrophosphatase [Deltaproteobacteria bacterium]|nr:MAG: CoA pyrophosphatase [Deltaproteobacteria bacterium]
MRVVTSQLEEVRQRLRAYRPTLIESARRERAAVGILLSERADGFDILFIERAERAGDPWSGHMAFPGGRVDAGDANSCAAAEREVREEVGVSLAGAERLGRLDDVSGRRGGRGASLVVSAFVYAVDRPARLETNHEVREALWVCGETLLDPAHHIEYVYPVAGSEIRSPGIVVGDPERHVVWGLTYRVLRDFFGILGRSFPGA